MKLDYEPTAREIAGIAQQIARHNAENGTALDEAGYVLAMAVKPLYAYLANQFDPGTTGDVKTLREAVKADPNAAKAAIEAAEAKEAADAAVAEAAALEAAQPVIT